LFRIFILPGADNKPKSPPGEIQWVNWVTFEHATIALPLSFLSAFDYSGKLL
jgi:hypothetical protein